MLFEAARLGSSPMGKYLALGHDLGPTFHQIRPPTVIKYFFYVLGYGCDCDYDYGYRL